MVPLDFLCDFLLGHRDPKSAPRSGYFDHFNTQNHPTSLRHALECTQGSTFCIYQLPLKPPCRDGPKNFDLLGFRADQRSSWQPWINRFCLPSGGKCSLMTAPWHLCQLWGTQKNRLSKLVKMVPSDVVCNFLLGHRDLKSAPRSGEDP